MIKLTAAIILIAFAPTAGAQQNYTLRYLQFTSQQQSLNMAYIYERSPAGNGKTIVLLHGKNFSETYWNSTAKELLKKGYDVLAPDQIGFGASSKPIKYQYSFQQLAINTRTLLDTLGIKQPVILGHSMGGMLAVRFALMYPDCSQLILEDPLGLEDWKLYIPYSTIDSEYKKELAKTPAALKEYMVKNYFHNEWKAAYDSLLAESSRNLSDKDYAWDMALTTDMIFTQPVYYEFAKLKVPVVLITGELDRTAPGKERADKGTVAMLGNYPKLSREASAKIPVCRAIELKGLGHIPHIENFNLFISTLEKVLDQK